MDKNISKEKNNKVFQSAEIQVVIERIEEMISDSKFTQSKISELAEASPSQIYKFRNLQNDIGSTRLIRLLQSQELEQYNLNYIFKGQGELLEGIEAKRDFEFLREEIKAYQIKTDDLIKAVKRLEKKLSSDK